MLWSDRLLRLAGLPCAQQHCVTVLSLNLDCRYGVVLDVC